MEPEERWDTLVERWLARDGIDTMKMLSADGLCGAQRKAFACLVRRRLMLKLPEPRVDALVAEGVGERAGPGDRKYREWILVEADRTDRWDGLVGEAHAFVVEGRS